MPHTGIARRTDLNLRSEYPDLRTTIYKISEDRFEILCDGVNGDFLEFSEHFDNAIKSFTAPVVVTQIRPSAFLDIIPPISDKEISKGFEGMSMSIVMFRNILIAKFPKINFTRIEQEFPKIIIYTANYVEDIPDGKVYHYTSLADKQLLEFFLAGLKMPLPFEIKDEDVTDLPDLKIYHSDNPVQIIEATKIGSRYAYDFSRRDEALWFDRIDNIFEGNFTKKDLYFYDDKEYSCYVDYSSFKNIDLRNHLLLFQTVYLTLPYDKHIEGWLKESNIKKVEFLDLIACGRVKLVLTQPEFRYDHTFLPEAYAANPNGVILRRAISALHQIDLVEMSDNYILNDPNILRELMPFCEAAAKISNTKASYFYDMLVWPIKARRQSFN